MELERKLTSKLARQYKVKPNASWHFIHPRIGEIQLEELNSLNTAKRLADEGIALEPVKEESTKKVKDGDNK